MPDQSAPHTVFVSHSHADNELCDRYVAALRARGLDVWYDRTNMQDGHMLNAEIEAQLEARTAFVVLLTPASVASYWVKLEAGAFQSLAAQDSTRLILPVRIGDCKVPLLMAGIKWIDAVTLGFDAAVEAMTKALSAPTQEPHPRSLPVRGEGSLASGRGNVRRSFQPIQGVGASGGRPPASSSPQRPRRQDMGVLIKDAETYLIQGKNSLALDTIKRALVLDPNDAEAWSLKGDILLGLGRYDEMAVAYERAVELRQGKKG